MIATAQSIETELASQVTNLEHEWYAALHKEGKGVPELRIEVVVTYPLAKYLWEINPGLFGHKPWMMLPQAPTFHGWPVVIVTATTVPWFAVRLVNVPESMK